METGFQRGTGGNWRASTEQDLLGVPPAKPEVPGSGSVQLAAGRLLPDSGTAAATAAPVPCKLVDLVKPGPSGTVASTAAAASAVHAAVIKAAPDVGPGGLLATAAAASQSCRTSMHGVMQDLLRAAEKAMASGLGDWHLQALQDISPQFQEHVLMGVLGPETLKHKHKLPEQQILQLYGLLYRHCTGFQLEVQAALAGAAHTEQLLASVWTAFAQLWDECVQVTFQGEVLAAMQELQGTYAALLDTQDVLAATQQENAALKERCNEFVKANLDHMLAWRPLKTKADALEGEVSMLSSANNEISLRAAATNARNTQLTVQLEGLGARLSGAEQQIKEREDSLAAARVALMEKDSGLCRLEAQVAALEQQLLAAGQAAKKQDGSIGDLQRQVESQAQLVQDAERRVADKQRAYNLLHADFAKQKAEAAEMADRAAKVEHQLAVVQQQLAGAHSLVSKAEGWQRRWEVCQMEVEDLQAANTRAMMRRQELVRSYWPVMERLGQAEDVVAALTQQVKGLGQEPSASLVPRDTRAMDATAISASGPPAVKHSSSNNISNSSGSSTNTATSCSSDGSSNELVAKQSAQQLQEVQHERAAAALDVGQPDNSSSSSSSGGGIQPGAAAAAAPLPQGPETVPNFQPAEGLGGMASTIKHELQQLQDSYLLLQDEYWRQKERLMAIELEAGQLRVTSKQALETAAQATATLSEAQQEAAKYADKCSKLEADIVGCKSWIRELEQTEQKYLKAIREQGALEDAAIAAQRQLGDCRTALAAAEANWRLAQAAAEAVAKERTRLLMQLALEMNKSTLVEQALQRVHKQEVSSSRAAYARLQATLDQQAAELATARVQLTDARKECHSAVEAQQTLQVKLQQAEHHNGQLGQQLQQASAFLSSTLQKLESLEGRVSYINCSSINSSSPPGQTVEVAVEAAVHLLERLLVSLQCLAADAGTISNAAAAAKIEVLVRSLMEGLEASAAGRGTVAGQLAGSRHGPAAAALLIVLRNASGAASKQRVQEVEQQVSVLQLQLSDSSAQLSAAMSATSRLQRALQLKTRAVASLERQLAAAESQLMQLQGSQASKERTILQLQQELAEARLDHAQLSAVSTAQAGELQAARNRAAEAESEMQQQRQAAAEAAAVCSDIEGQLHQAVEASRNDALEARTAAGAAAAATLQVEQLQAQLAAARERCAALEADVKDSRQRADTSKQSARDAEYRAVQTTTLLADARRELDFTQKMLQVAQAAKEES